MIALLIIDPQEDYSDWSRDSGAIPVPGAHSIYKSIAHLISDHIDAFADIYVTLQSHHVCLFLVKLLCLRKCECLMPGIPYLSSMLLGGC
jgi:hypothetical protein